MVNSSERKHQSVFLDLRTGSYIQATGYLINDFDGVPINQVPSGCANDNELIYIINNERLEAVAKTNNSAKFINTYQKIKPLTMSDNPVLAFVKLK
jgi:hypothetical protein